MNKKRQAPAVPPCGCHAEWVMKDGREVLSWTSCKNEPSRRKKR